LNRFLILIFSIILCGQIFSQGTDSVMVVKQVDSVLQLSRNLSGKNDFVKALELNLVAEKISLDRFGRESVSYGRCCNSHSRIKSYQGEFLEAEKWAIESRTILEKVLGKDHPEYALVTSNLGILYKEMGDFEKSESLQLEAKDTREKVLGKAHRDYAQSLNNLGILYKDMGLYEKAEPMLMESLANREKSKSKDPLSYSKGLNNLAVLYLQMGEFNKAEPLFLQTVTIRETASGKDSPDYANALSNLATLYLEMRNFEKAELIFVETKSIIEKTLGKEHLNYAENLNNLSALYIEKGYAEKAIPFLNEACKIWKQSLGTDHSLVGSCLNNLGRAFLELNDFKQAEIFFNQSLSIKEKAIGKEHPKYAEALFNLASLNLEIKNLKKAEQIFLETKSIWEKTLGKQSVEYAGNLYELAELYEEQNRFSESESLLSEMYKLEHSRLSKACTFLSEQELGHYASAFQTRGLKLNAYILARFSKKLTEGVLPQLVYNNLLFYKGFLLNAAAKINNLSCVNPDTEEINLRLKGYRRLLATELAKPLQERKRIEELESKSNTLEKELSKQIADYGSAFRAISWKEVQKVLKSEEAAVEFVSFPMNFPERTNKIGYAALLLKPGNNQPEFISLFEESSLDSILRTHAERKADYVNGLYTIADRGAIAVESPKRSLYEILWQPLEKELAGIKTIYFSPAGLLHRINLDAVPVSETETLADKYQLIELNSTRQLVVPTPLKNVNNEAVLFGGIQFEQDSLSVISEPIYASRSRGELSFNYVDSTLRGGSWNYLAGTEREVNAIEKIMQEAGVKTNLKKGYSATEESFKNTGANNSASPRILHIATHGYFFSDPDRTISAGGRMAHDSATSEGTAKAATNKPKLEFETTEPVFKISDHPMLRSGLIMAGGNAAWQGKQTLEGKEDGILTAYEISQMNLSNTELVVLSACETGLGDIQGNEGVYGLQRAFKIAGAKYLIMSLWQVPDKQTSMLMTTFYKKWLEENISIPDAFHAAQKELRNIGLDPYQWAGFVLVE
jgi:CHAT domain-containing protein